MTVKLLTEHNLEFLSLKEAAQARLSIHLSKCHIVGNQMSLFAAHILSLALFLLVSSFDNLCKQYGPRSSGMIRIQTV